MAQGANIETRDQNGRTPLVLAAGNPNVVETLRVLLVAGANVQAKDDNDTTALLSAVSSGNTAGVALLLEKKPSTEEKNAALFENVEHEPAVIMVMPAPGDPNTVSEPPHIPEPPSPRVQIAKLLLESGADLEARNDDGATPLIWAAQFGANAVVEFLLERGAAVDAVDRSCDTALIAAACDCAVIDMPDTLDSVKMLLERKANIEAKNYEGETALIRAAGLGRTEIVEWLLDKGADIESKDTHGNTALLISAEGGAYPTAETVKLLLDRKANIEATDGAGNTPLIKAAEGNGSEKAEIVKLLLSRGANVRAKNAHGDTALTLAKKTGQADVVALLAQADANPR